MSTIAAVFGRIFIAVIFILAGFGKLIDPAATEAMITGTGLPAGLALPVGAFEVLAGLALVFGVMTRLTAVLLFGFVALTTLMFHNRLTDPMQQAMALKNLAIMGGLLLVFAHSQIWWSWDRMRRERRGDRATLDAERRGETAVLDAERRAHEAELRAVRAEGRAEVTGSSRVVSDIDRDRVPEVRRRRWWG